MICAVVTVPVRAHALHEFYDCFIQLRALTAPADHPIAASKHEVMSQISRNVEKVCLLGILCVRVAFAKQMWQDELVRPIW